MASLQRGVGSAATKSSSAIGMMEGAYFVPRTELLAWVNQLLQINIQKVEQCASGAIYCQILDTCSPGSVAMRKVNWMAKSDHEFIPNYKVLQTGFDKNGIVKHIEVDKLIRAKYQDNLEFLQWMKCHWDRERMADSSSYDPVKVREGRPLPPWAQDAAPAGGRGYSRDAGKENLRPAAASVVTSSTASSKRGGGGGGAKVGSTAAVVSTKPRSPPPASRNEGGNRSPMQSCKGQPAAPVSKGPSVQRDIERDELRLKVEAQSEEIIDLKGSLDGLEQERDYYFKKLREVEILTETLKARMDPDVTTVSKLLDDIQHILYSEEEMGGHS